MEIWYSDEHTDNVKLSFRIDRQLFSAVSAVSYTHLTLPTT